MKKVSIMLAIALFCVANTLQAQIQVTRSFQDSLSYAIGITMGKNFAKDLDPAGIKLEENLFMKGMREYQAPVYNDAQINALFQKFQMILQQQQAEAGKKDMQAGLDFLAKNKNEAGVKTTASGLQYKVVKAVDTGAQPTAASTVKVHYRGTLINGKQFDSSYDRGQPAEFPLGGVIKGWTEGLQLMKVGEKFMFYIPSELAYGQNGPPGIGPNQTLIFEVELLEVK